MSDCILDNRFYNPQVRTPVLRYGGKVQQVRFYLNLLGRHECYVEPFGGGGAVLMAKWPSRSEVYGDLDGDVCNLFRVLRDPASSARLKELLTLTPYSREEHQHCKRCLAECLDPVERARMYYTLIRQSFQRIPGNPWAYSRTQTPRSFQTSIELLDAACHRLRHVQIENEDYRKVVARYDSADTLHFLDPPYFSSTRTAKRCYRHELSDQDHCDLLDVVRGLRGRVLLCGYDHPLYQSALHDWQRVENRVTCSATMWTRGRTGKKPMRTEVVWVNRRAGRALAA